MGPLDGNISQLPVSRDPLPVAGTPVGSTETGSLGKGLDRRFILM